MSASRRTFVASLTATISISPLLITLMKAQAPMPPQQQGTMPKDEDPPLPLKNATKAILEANQKGIKKDVERLFGLAEDLKNEVQKTDSAQVLSLAMLKKTEEIEKLAKDIRSRAKG